MKNNFADESERRIKKRFPVLKNLDIPLMLFLNGNKDTEIKAVLLNISAAGMGMIVFSPLEAGQTVNLSLKIEHLDASNLKGTVKWSRQHKDAWSVGIDFFQIDDQLAEKVNLIAEDFVDCEIEIALGAVEICFKECHYYNFCTKPIKIPDDRNL